MPAIDREFLRRWVNWREYLAARDAGGAGTFVAHLATEQKLEAQKLEARRGQAPEARLQQSVKDAVVGMWVPVALTTLNSKSMTLVRSASRALHSMASSPPLIKNR